MKKQSRLSKLENNLYYGISRYFWHLIIGLAVLGVISGLLIYIWATIPPSKENVRVPPKPVKKAYPALKDVSLDEVIKHLPKEKKIKKKEIAKPAEEEVVATEETYVPDEKSIDSVALQQFEETLGQTRNLIPVQKNRAFWLGKGMYVFKSERDRKLYKKTKNPKYRTWVSTQAGFRQHYLQFTERQNIDSYNQKTELLNALNNILQNVDSVNRIPFIERKFYNIPVNRLGLAKTKTILQHIAPVIRKLPEKAQLDGYSLMYLFVIRNPNDGLSMIDFNKDIIDSVAPSERLKFIRNIQKEYTYHYNNNFTLLRNATKKFLPLLSGLPVDKQSDALKIYYQLFSRNNRQLKNEISQIETEYRHSMQNWEERVKELKQEAQNRYMLKKHKKRTYKYLSIRGVVIGFAGILSVTLLLLILSMIRNVNRLSEAIMENNRLFAERFTEDKITDEQEETK